MSDNRSERIVYAAKHPLGGLSAELFSACKYHVQESVKRPGGAEFYQILIVLEGSGRVKHNGREYPLRRGSAFYTSMTAPIEYVNHKGLASAFVTATGEGVPALAQSYGVKDFLYTDSISSQRYQREVEKIVDSYHGGEKSGKLSAMVYSFYADFFGNCEKPLPGAEEVALYIERNFDKKLTLALLARVASSSVSGLCHTFRKKYGKTVIGYLSETRLFYAKKLLQAEPALSMKEVAVLSGFEDASYFSRAYKKQYGITPGEERKIAGDGRVLA